MKRCRLATGLRGPAAAQEVSKAGTVAVLPGRQGTSLTVSHAGRSARPLALAGAYGFPLRIPELPPTASPASRLPVSASSRGPAGGPSLARLLLCRHARNQAPASQSACSSKEACAAQPTSTGKPGSLPARGGQAGVRDSRRTELRVPSGRWITKAAICTHAQGPGRSPVARQRP